MHAQQGLFQAKLPTPFCVIGVRTEGDEIAEIVFLPKKETALPPQNKLTQEARQQLKAYLAQPGYRFDLPLKKVGTTYQHRVWQKINAIPSGQTRSYGSIAKELRSGPRAVGQACGANYFPLIIPCHRVVASQGLGGFANNDGGFHLSIKKWLLAHEQEKRY